MKQSGGNKLRALTTNRREEEEEEGGARPIGAAGWSPRKPLRETFTEASRMSIWALSAAVIRLLLRCLILHADGRRSLGGGDPAEEWRRRRLQAGRGGLIGPRC